MISTPKIGKLPFRAAIALTVLALAGLLVGQTIRDRIPFVAAFYYATPAVLCAALFASAALLWYREGYRKMMLLCAVGGLLAAGLWHLDTYVRSGDLARAGEAGGRQTARVLVWNMFDGDLGFAGVFDHIRRENPDLIVLTEAGRDMKDPGELRAFWQQAFPEYAVSPTDHGLVVLTRGRIAACRFGRLGRTGGYQHVLIEFDGWKLNLVQPEIKSNPLRPRGPSLEALLRIVQPMAAGPLLVAGDFNTPADSVWFEAWRAVLVNAFESAGKGYYLTWPVPCPVLALDHAWVSRSVRVSRCHLGWSWRSDHRPLLVDLGPVEPG